MSVTPQVLITRLDGSTDTSLHLVVLPFDGYLYLIDAVTGIPPARLCWLFDRPGQAVDKTASLCWCMESNMARPETQTQAEIQRHHLKTDSDRPHATVQGLQLRCIAGVA